MILEIINTEENSRETTEISIETIESTESESPLRQKECRICFETEKNDDPLLYPCMCDGFSKYIHKNCLIKWRQINIEKPPFLKCMECGSEYNIKFPYKIETYTYLYDTIELTTNPKICLIYFSMLGASLFFKTLDRATGNHLIYMIDENPQEEFRNILKTDAVYGTLFTFSYLNFMIFTTINILFIIFASINVNNHIKYYSKMIIPLIFHLIFSSNIYSIYYIFKLESSSYTPEIVINFSSIFLSI